MRKISLGLFLKNYIGLVMIMLLIYLVLGPSENVSLPFVIMSGLPLSCGFEIKMRCLKFWSFTPRICVSKVFLTVKVRLYRGSFS